MNFTGVREKKPDKTVQQYKPVTDFMTKVNFTLSPEQSIADAMDVFLEHHISGAPVIDEMGRLIGIISQIDCLKIMVDEAMMNLPHGKITISQYMSTNVETVSIDSDVLDVASKFMKTGFRRFPVIDHNNKLVGEISQRGILAATRELKTSTW